MSDYRYDDPRDEDTPLPTRRDVPTMPLATGRNIEPPPPDLDRTHAYESSASLRPVQRGALPSRRTSVERRRRSPFYLPAWSIALTLLGVVVIAGGIIAAILAVGGNYEVGGEPRIVIITAEPTPTLTVDTNVQSAPAAPIGGAAPTLANQEGAVPQFPLEGPTLPPVILSPTPLTIAVGQTVIVTTDAGLNVREGAGTDFTARFQANQGELFTVIGGPSEGSVVNTATRNWWQIQDPADPSRSGWVVEDYIEPVPPTS